MRNAKISHLLLLKKCSKKQTSLCPNIKSFIFNHDVSFKIMKKLFFKSFLLVIISIFKIQILILQKYKLSKFNFDKLQSMISEQVLTKKVIEFLRQKHGIRLNLPNLFRSIDSKVTLKYLKSFAMGKKQNRYQILVQKTQELLKKNLLNLQKIKIFSQDFFNTITEDIIILQENQRLRRKIPLARQEILIKSDQMEGFEKNLKKQCKELNDKQDILKFIENNLKEYLQKINMIGNEYESVNRLQILTSINIDDLYQDNIAQEEDYSKHFGPLLQVLTKLKSNVIKIYQDIEQCDPYDVPLKCVNFLANCKNLVNEMEPFLLNKQCIFNRMIFFVVKCQKENLQLVASNFQRALVFCRKITSDLFKSYFLNFIFPLSYNEIKQSLEGRRQELLRLINDEQLPELKLNEQLKIQIQKLQIVRLKIKDVKATIGIGKTWIMKDYVVKKQCKKLNLIKKLKQEYLTLKKMIQKFSKYYEMKKTVQKLQNNQIQESAKIIKQIKTLQKMKDVSQIIEITAFQKEKLVPQKIFQTTFLRLQQLILQVNTLKGDLEMQLDESQDDKNPQLLIEYISHRIQKLDFINKNFLDLETKLLNTYLVIQAAAQKLQKQSLHVKEQTLSDLEKYLQKGLNPNIGFIVTNQDTFCQQVKAKILDLNKAQYLIREWKKETISDQGMIQAGKKQEDQIKFYRSNLQYLLILFQGSMDQKIFEMMMDKLNFDSQDHLEKQKKVQQFINELNKYVNDLKNLLKSHPLSQIHPKIYKIIKDRIQLYQIISDIYTECLFVFKQTKNKDFLYNIENKGLMLFDEGVFKYVLMVYQFRNKLRMEIQELKQLLLPPRSRNYLIDELYEPFAIRYGQFIGFKEEQLLNFTLRLQHALNIEASQKKIISLFQESLQKPYSEDYFGIVENLCKQMSQINNENWMVINLQNQPVVVHNMVKFKELILPSQEYFKLSEQLMREIQKNDSQLRQIQKLYFQSSRVNELRNCLIENWKIFKNQGRQESNKISRVESRVSRSSKPKSKMNFINKQSSFMQ